MVIQFRHNLVRDVQKRAVDESLRDNLAIATPVSRVLAERIPPFQVKAHWDSPELAVAGECLRLSARLRGGARYSPKGINLTMEGAVHADCRPEVAVTGDGQPVVILSAPSLSALRVADLKLSYAGGEDSLSWIDTRLERVLLRPVLGKKLLKRLAGLPLSYLPEPVPLRIGTERDTAALGYRAANVSVDPHGETLSLELGRSGRPPGAAPPGSFLAKPEANLAVAVTETGLNQVLGLLCDRGHAAGTTTVGETPVAWRWSRIRAGLSAPQHLRLTGELWCDGRAVPVDASARCSLTPAGQLAVRLPARAAPSTEKDLVAAATAALLGRVFAGVTFPLEPGGHKGKGPAPGQELRQRFRVPGTDILVEAPVVDLAVRDGYLVALYEVPLDARRSLLTIDDAKPEPRIVQPVVPRQAAPGAPVFAHLDAVLAKPAEPPCDYVWQAGKDAKLVHRHKPVAVVTTEKALRADGAEAGEPLKLATVKLKVIDLLGQVGETEFDATYHPSLPPREGRDDGGGADVLDPPYPARLPGTRSSGGTLARGFAGAPLSVVAAAVIAVGGGAVGGVLGGTIGYQRGLHDPAVDRRGPAGPPGTAGAPGATGPAGPS
ncbi:hypothetical protein ACFSYJ_44155, partial [Amycolatopsis samaneae]